MEKKKSLDLHTEFPALVTQPPPRKMCSNSTLVLQVTVMVYGKDLFSQGIFYREACSRW